MLIKIIISAIVLGIGAILFICYLALLLMNVMISSSDKKRNQSKDEWKMS